MVRREMYVTTKIMRLFHTAIVQAACKKKLRTRLVLKISLVDPSVLTFSSSSVAHSCATGSLRLASLKFRRNCSVSGNVGSFLHEKS